MKSWQNTMLQILGTLAQVGNIAYGLSGSGVFGGGKTQIIVGASVGAIQIIGARIASWYNPDGTPAALPYVPVFTAPAETRK
jgi:hypothetical protein